MDFAFSNAQQQWHDATVQFAREELVVPEPRHEGGFWREGFARCARFGIPGLPVPEGHGGRGQDLPTTVAAMEGLGYACNDSGLIFALNAALWTVTMPILEFGNETQKQRYLRGLCDGTLLGANAASEPDAGSDIFAMQTRAERRGDRWILNGRKTWITAGPVADLFLCFATTDPSKGILGISAFLIEREAQGLRVVREIPKLGMKTVPMGELALRGMQRAAGRPAGPRGPRRVDLQRRHGTRAGRDPRQCCGHDAPAARTMRPARPDAKAVRPADRQVPVGLEPDRRHGHAAGDQPFARVSLCVAQGAR